MKTVLVALVTLVVGLAAGAIGISRMTAASKATPTPVALVTPTSVVVRTGPTVIKALQTQAKLETVVMKVVKDVSLKREQGTLNRCGQELTYLGYYDVTAGMDLSKLEQKNIDVTNDGQLDNAVVTVTLPKAEIMHAILDTKNSRAVAQADPAKLLALDCDNMLGDMTQEAQQKIGDAVQQDAIEQGILLKAGEQAQVVIERILLETGYKHVNVIVSK